MVAIDQDLMDEFVLGTGEREDMDTFMGRLFRNGSNDMPSIIPQNITKRCRVSATRPATACGVSVQYYYLIDIIYSA